MDYRAVDVIDNAAAVEAMLVAENFSGVVHAVGMLLANDLNRFASGSGSVPRPGTTYDQARPLDPTESRGHVFLHTAQFRFGLGCSYLSLSLSLSLSLARRLSRL